MNVDQLLDLTLEERVRHLELYSTQHVDNWLDVIFKRLDALEGRRADVDLINVILSEDARVENGRLVNGPYLAVKIAQAIVKGIV